MPLRQHPGLAAIKDTSSPLPRLTQFDFHRRLLDVPGVAVILFTRPGCGACKAMGRVLAAWHDTPDAPALFAVDAEVDTALVREFEGFHLPALCVFRAGTCHGPLEAAPRLARLREALASCLARPPREAP